MNIFISENESKDKIFDELTSILDIQKFKNEVSDIFKKANNNYVGYYLFEDKDDYYKIFILPKHIPKPKHYYEEIDVIKKFIEYLKIYYKLKSKYDKYEPNSLNLKSSFELSFDSNTNNYSAQDIEQFIFYKYQSLLIDILRFFDTHKAHKRIKKEYISQTIKYNLNLTKNIKEPNKTKIHQDKIDEIIFSQIATITFGVISLFNRTKLNLVQEKELQNDLYKLTTKIKNILQKKYQIEKGFDLTINKLLSSKILKCFRKKKESLNLYINLLSIFGVENFYDESENKQINRTINSESLFIRPEKLYEWFVYDKLKEKYFSESYEIYKDGFYDSTTIMYILDEKKVKSNPDLILKHNDKLFVIDVKWKNIGDNIPDIYDILKLKRDTEVRLSQSKNIYSILIYPNVTERLILEYLVENKESTFNLYTRRIEISMDSFLNDIFESVDKISILNSEAKNLHSKIINFKEAKINYSEFLSKYNSDGNIEIEEFVENLIHKELDVISNSIIKQYDIDEILNDSSCKQIRIFLDKHRNYLEEATEKFILSVASVMFYINKSLKDIDKFDYSLHASGLWKAIEVELNASLIYLIRFRMGICREKYYIKKETCLSRQCISTSSTFKVWLTNEKNEKNKLDNILLGNFPFLLNNILVDSNDDSAMKKIFSDFYIDADINEYVEKFKFFTQSIVDIRNPYVHKDFMTFEVFNNFINLVFNEIDDIFDFNDLVRFKKNVNDYIKAKF